MAKGGRRLKSNFETALDLLTVCSIVWLRKSSGGLDLLTEAQVVERFPKLRTSLPALYAGYYVAELLSDWTQDYDPHPVLFDAARDALRDFGAEGISTALRLAAFELTLLRELGYSPVLAHCAVCGRELLDDEAGLAFCPAVGGLACRDCQPTQRERMPIGVEARRLLWDLGQPGEPWRISPPAAAQVEIRRLLGQYVAWLMGHRPRLLPYLNQLS